MTEVSKTGRKLVVVSGYYGFNNLGDEAILEELISELKTLVAQEDIVVLSQDPNATASLYGVKAINRWQISKIAGLLGQTKLFISGGGGLFQDTGSVKSVIYYGGLINIARMAGAKVMVYAQGLGPLKAQLSKILTRQTFKLVNAIAVRDPGSQKMLRDWQIDATLTGDPVWLLTPGKLPQTIAGDLEKAKEHGKLLALSLRSGGGFDREHIACLAETLIKTIEEPCTVMLLPLQKNQDTEPLAYFEECYKKLGGKTLAPDTSLLARPSQWLALIGAADLLIGMRLHSLIMALSAQVPVIGIAYDPKVKAVMEEFNQPILPYQSKGAADCAPIWQDTIAQTLANLQPVKLGIASTLTGVKSGACQNQAIIAKMLAQ